MLGMKAIVLAEKLRLYHPSKNLPVKKRKASSQPQKRLGSGRDSFL